ncbi:hypothetical protein RHDC4_00567 [Rhodocyclaceae bacterium]|nr:hypothetical protein RHDC4_00567 [Rhodocyclaceae bacterium]
MLVSALSAEAPARIVSPAGESYLPDAVVIVLNLVCRHEHRFEGWFASLEAFEDQQQRALVNCPICNSVEVSRLPSGPHVVTSSSRTADHEEAGHESLEAVQGLLLEALKTAAQDSENVGHRFPEEARRIHYKEAPARSIRGVASADETRDLLDEGIVVIPLPVPPSEDTH